MPKSLFIFFLFSFSSLGSLSSNQLIIPEAFDVIKVNGEKSKTFIFSNNRKIKLKQGRYSIELRYVDFYDQGFDDFEKVISEPFLLHFNYDGNGDLTTDFKKPESIAEAKKYAENPQLKILQKSGGALENQNLSQLNELKKAENIKPKPKKAQAQKDDDKMALEQLRLWWGRANLEQRQRFIKEILQ
jgi:uncharacterized protein YccT (UPF0319 family)